MVFKAWVSFRADYRQVTRASLKNLQDSITTSILGTPGVEYLSHGGCDACFDVNFCRNGGQYFSYHRGMEKSSILFGRELVINDVLVSQDGKLYYDWDMEESKLKAKNGILFAEQTKTS